MKLSDLIIELQKYEAINLDFIVEARDFDGQFEILDSNPNCCIYNHDIPGYKNKLQIGN